MRNQFTVYFMYLYLWNINVLNLLQLVVKSAVKPVLVVHLVLRISAGKRSADTVTRCQVMLCYSQGQGQGHGKGLELDKVQNSTVYKYTIYLVHFSAT